MSLQVENNAANETSESDANELELKTKKFNILKEAIKSSYDSRFGEFFRVPVDPIRDNAPDYLTLIEKPMDLGTITKKLDDNMYSDPDECISDFSLMISNCHKYNPPSNLIIVHCKEINKIFNKKMSKYPDSNLTLLGPQKRHASVSPKKSDDLKIDTPKSKSIKQKKVANNHEKVHVTPDSVATRESTRIPKKTIKEFPETAKIHTQPQALHFCETVLAELFNKRHLEYATPFLHPVDPIALNIPDYHNVIKYPMDLSTVRAKLKSGHYSSANQFIRDVRLIFTNCFLYNQQNTEISSAGSKLQRVFECQIAACSKEIFHELFVPEIEVEDYSSMIGQVYSRSMRRSNHVETRPIMDYLQNIDKKVNIIAEEVLKIKTDRLSKTNNIQDGTAYLSKRPSQLQRPATPGVLTPLKQLPSSSSIRKSIDLERGYDNEPMTCDEKLSLQSQIASMSELKLKEILGIITQREPWSKKMTHNQKAVEFDLGSLSNGTLRALERYCTQTVRKRADTAYRKKCSQEEKKTRKEDLYNKLNDVVSKISGKPPVSKSVTSKVNGTDKLVGKIILFLLVDELNTARLSESDSSTSDGENDEFMKRFNIHRKPTSLLSQGSNFTPIKSTIANTPTTNNATSTSFVKSEIKILNNTVSHSLTDLSKNGKTQHQILSTSTSNHIRNSNFHDMFLSKLGVSKQSSTLNETENTKLHDQPSQSDIDQLRAEERNKRREHIGKIDINAQSEAMKTFEEKC